MGHGSSISEPPAGGRDAGAAVFLGIDPGLQRTGYAAVACDANERRRVIEAGVVRLNPRRPIEARLVELQESLAQIITAHRPDVLVCEQLYAHYKHPRTAILMGHARGVILALAAQRRLEVMHVAATQAKKMLTGNGRASKAQMQRAVAAMLRLAAPPEPHDVADAIAIGLCGLQLRAIAGDLSRAAQEVSA
ncbi:MAG: hypothetical protein D6744_16585 [Planctomycetota bacterium]|nr:MAG: hypothetical protein D6744_16585 [Planctomycetota bacterium]